MAIYKFIANNSFGPDEIKVMSEAYEGSLIDVGILNREDPITELIAKSIVNVTATGERDPKKVMERALNALGVRRDAAQPIDTSASAIERPSIVRVAAVDFGKAGTDG
jgi:hypothetical protein